MSNPQSPFRTREDLLWKPLSEAEQAVFDRQMKAARRIMAEDREALAKLAKL